MLFLLLKWRTSMYENILEYFPQNIKQIFKNTLNQSNLEEIRLRCGKPIILKYSDKEVILDYLLTNFDIQYIFERICENSIYTYQNQICNRFYNY